MINRLKVIEMYNCFFKAKNMVDLEYSTDVVMMQRLIQAFANRKKEM